MSTLRRWFNRIFRKAGGQGQLKRGSILIWMINRDPTFMKYGARHDDAK